jgi:hypothetical protein
MDPIAIAAIAIAANIIALLALAAWATYQAEKARTAGYDEGYEDAARVGHDLGINLELRLGAAKARITDLLQEQESITQVADRRIALYAGQSFVTEDIKLLLTAATHLKTAAKTYMAFPEANLTEPARAAQSTCEQLAQMVVRIQQQLEGAEPPAIIAEASA